MTARRSRLVVSLACVLASLSLTAAAGASAGRPQELQLRTPDDGTAPIALAALAQCVTAVVQSERSATFSGEMTTIPGSSRMEIRTEILWHRPGGAQFQLVSAPGLGGWHEADAGVTSYTYLKQVTNLSAPAIYRAKVDFRWLNARGRTIKHMDLGTRSCVQPAEPPTPVQPAGPPTPSSPSSG
jgi:hypothetical protein